MVRLRLPSMRDAVFGAILHHTRRHPGQHLQPSGSVLRSGWTEFSGCTTSLARELARPLCHVTASNLEYMDDVGQLDRTAAEASGRVSALASGSRASASMEISALKSKGMHVHPGGCIRERLVPVSTEVEVEALDLPHSYPEWDRSLPTTRGLAVH